MLKSSPNHPDPNPSFKQNGLESPHLTQRPSAADFPAAMAMMRAISPSSPEQGEGLSFTRQSQNARVSWMYA